MTSVGNGNEAATADRTAPPGMRIQLPGRSPRGSLEIEELDKEFGPGAPSSWDQWVPRGHLCLSRRFLRCAALAEMEGFRVAPLALTSAAGERVGIAISYRNTIDAADMAMLPGKGVVRLIRRIAPQFLKYDVIEIGIPVAQGFPMRTAIVPEEAVTAVAEWAMTLAKAPTAPLVIVRDIDDVVAPRATRALQKLGFHRWPIPVGFVLPLPFASFQDYQSKMRSSYRRRLAGNLRETAPLRVQVESDFAPLAPDLAHLWLTVFNRATQHKRVVIPTAFFEATSHLPESRVLLLRRPDNSVAAFALLFHDGDVLRFHCTGFTREAAVSEGVYFRLLYEIVRYGIEVGCRSLDLGITAATAKMTIGAKPIHLNAWVWHRSRAKRRALDWITRVLMRPAFLPQRSVFHEDVPLIRDPGFAE